MNLRKRQGRHYLDEKSLADFMAFAANEDYLAGIGHRTAALQDSRLLPLVELWLEENKTDIQPKS